MNFLDFHWREVGNVTLARNTLIFVIRLFFTYSNVDFPFYLLDPGFCLFSQSYVYVPHFIGSYLTGTTSLQF